MKRPDQMKTPGCNQAFGGAVKVGDLGKQITAHGPAIDRAALMIDFARCSSTKFHEAYFARMAAKLLRPFAPGDIDAAASRVRSLRLQSVGEPGRGGAWS